MRDHDDNPPTVPAVPPVPLAPPDPIGDWYAQKRTAFLAAWAKVQAAQERGADKYELHRLEQAALDAGDTGD